MEHGRRQGAVLTIRTVAETGSTNADMLALARGDAGEGLWLRAERQSGGRGRHGRAWVSPPGNLYASTIVRLGPADPPPATLALVSAVALQQVVAALLHAIAAPPVFIKWPNDLTVNGEKLSGILLERAGDAVVIGFGINVTLNPDLPDRPATSLSAHGVSPDPADILAALADAFARWLAIWRSEGLAPVRARWLERAHPRGTALTARLADGGAIDGLFDGLDPDGALILRLADGSARVIHAADIFLL